MPTLIRWPRRIPAGRVSPQVGITMDLTASVLAATGTSVPPAARLEGIDLFAILEGRTPLVERTLFWRVQTGGLVGCIRAFATRCFERHATNLVATSESMRAAFTSA